MNKIVPQLLPIEKSNHQQINIVKTNIINMFINRGFINKENKEKYINKFISEINDDYEYILNLDIETNYNTTIKNKKVYIKFFDYKISSINKISPIGELNTIDNNDNKYKILEKNNQK
jgi:hypothetical protein